MRAFMIGMMAVALGLPARAEEPAKPMKVPFLLMPTGHFLVEVKVNDQGPYKLIFDTGAPMMLISNRVAKETKLAKGSSSIFAPTQASVKKLEVGGVTAEGVPALVLDHPTVKAFSDAFKEKHGPIEGIVGFPFFARYKMTVDYQAKELTFTPNGYQPVDVMQSMMTALMSASDNAGKPRFVAPGALFGLGVDKPKDDEEAGVNVNRVAEDSPAAKAGLKKGDRLLTIDGRWTDSPGDAVLAASRVKVGKAVPVVVRRAGKDVTLSLAPALGY